MRLLFTIEQFLDIFAAYNTAIWPIYPLGYILAIIALYAIGKRYRWTDRYTTFLLAGFWLGTGIVYHIVFFAGINPAARIFGVLTAIEGALLLIVAVCGQLTFQFGRTFRHIFGYISIAYATVIYPLFGMALGHSFPAAPLFPITPCPMTIFTFGIFLLAAKPVRWYVWIIPLLWTLIGSVAAFRLTIIQDYGLLAAGIIGTILIIDMNRGMTPS